MTDTHVQLERIDAWEQALQAGQNLMQEASAMQAQAQADEGSRRWRAAAAKYRQARATYFEAHAKLEAPAMIGESPFKALQLLRDQAQELITRAQSELQALESSNRAEVCDKHISEAAALLQQANAALGEDNFASARSLALQASEQDPALQEAAERVMRAAEDAQGEWSSPIRRVLLVLLLLALVGSAVVYGPALWATLAEFLFPSGMIYMPIPR